MLLNLLTLGAVNIVFYTIISFIIWDINWVSSAGTWLTQDRAVLVVCVLASNFMAILVIWRL